MRGLQVAVIVMGIMIVAGVAVIAATVAHRLASPSVPFVRADLDEPAGTEIGTIAATGDRLAIQLRGGGPDRLVILDLRTMKVAGRVALAH
jgi:hypothetical protein